jgi:tetratricopeptide (TPR) repeat protein
LFTALLTRRIATVEELRLAAREIEMIARQAYSARRIEVLEYATQLMLDIPLPGQEIVSAHYQALCCWLKGDYARALTLSERVVESRVRAYRTKALLAIGTTYHRCGKTDEALPYFDATAQTALGKDPLSWTQALWMIANVRVRQGDCKNALKVFERIEPIVGFLSRNHPTLHCDFLNDTAFALGEAGRIEEGLRLVELALSSPCAPRFPHWTDTKNELEAKREATPVLVHIDLPQENASSPVQTEDRVEYNKNCDAAIAEHQTRTAQICPELNPEPERQIIGSTTTALNERLFPVILERLNTVIFRFYTNDYLNPSRSAAPAAGAHGRPASFKSKRVDKTSVIPRGPPRLLIQKG